MKCLLCALLCALPASAGEWKSKGEITVETRLFTDDDIDATVDQALGLFSRLEARYKKGPWRINLRGFARTDHEDDTRDLAALEEAYLGYRKSGWELRLGFQMLNWTATEAFHPADIINSRNLDSNIENPEKLGELMLSVRRRLGQGGLTLYYLPRYEEPNLPGPSSRLSFAPTGFTITDPIWLEDDGEQADDSYGNQWGLRFNQTIGDADISVFYLDHLDRQQPRFLADEVNATITPVYLRVENLGITWLHILGDWVLKLEAAHKDFQDQTGPFPIDQIDHTQAAFGIDYGWTTRSGGDATLLLEGQAILNTTEAERAGLSPFQRDLLFGMRYAFNDVMSRELLITLITDTERDQEILFNLDYQQRLTDTWQVRAGVRWIDAPPKDVQPVGLEFLDEANQVFVNLSRFF
ncbi:MAG: hypothetical protein QNK37_29690 [Acidobacteriota bacterium]|nr:hypothetical protein [Acidobacteriota bacterium]